MENGYRPDDSKHANPSSQPPHPPTPPPSPTPPSRRHRRFMRPGSRRPSPRAAHLLVTVGETLDIPSVPRLAQSTTAVATDNAATPCVQPAHATIRDDIAIPGAIKCFGVGLIRERNSARRRHHGTWRGQVFQSEPTQGEKKLTTKTSRCGRGEVLRMRPDGA